MKTINLVLTIALMIGLLSCDNSFATTDSDYAYSIEANDRALSSLEFSSDSTNLLDSEKEGLLQMREEEKLAGDVYAYFYKQYGLTPFSNINKSEIRHTTAILSLLNYFAIPDPALTEAGKFTNVNIQALYNQLISAGSTAELALNTGAFIEEYDIADLMKLIDETQNSDIKNVYTNLLNGSYHHLNAFTRVLKMRGVDYTPQILTQEVYNSIVN